MVHGQERHMIVHAQMQELGSQQRPTRQVEGLLRLLVAQALCLRLSLRLGQRGDVD